MKNLEKLKVPIDDISLAPVTNIFFIINGTKVSIETPLTITDFTSLWNTKKRIVKIATGINTYACIDKRHVDFYQVFPKE